MSYSFKVQGATKAEVSNLVAKELDKVCAGSHAHEEDRALMQRTADAAVTLLTDKDTSRDFCVQCWGSITVSDTFGTTGTSVGASASLEIKPTQV